MSRPLPILIAEDEPVTRRLLESALREMGHRVIATSDGLAAWEAIRRHRARIVIADWMMPGMDGLELVRRIRAMPDSSYIYTILLTARHEKQDVVAGLAAGADDYVVKPFDRDELMVRIRAGERVVRLEEELARRNEQLRRLTLIDELTGIGNRRAFDESLRRLHEHSRRFCHPLGLIMADIDRFKAYNDTKGHEAGDDALRAVARILKESVRTGDLCFRYGGEEFVCLLPETTLDGALIVAERLRDRVRDAGLPHPGNPPFGVVTISAGAYALEPGALITPEELLGRADQAMYEAKRSGRNAVRAWRTPALQL